MCDIMNSYTIALSALVIGELRASGMILMKVIVPVVGTQASSI